MANLQKKTKIELITMCNERQGEIENLRREVAKIQEQFDITDKQLQEVTQQKKHLEDDMKGTESSYNEERTKCAQEIQELRKKVVDRDQTINQQVDTYKELRKDYDKLVYENGINRSNAAKYKFATITFIVLFVIALIYACV